MQSRVRIWLDTIFLRFVEPSTIISVLSELTKRLKAKLRKNNHQEVWPIIFICIVSAVARDFFSCNPLHLLLMWKLNFTYYVCGSSHSKSTTFPIRQQ